jgi:hypothetical protein
MPATNKSSASKSNKRATRKRDVVTPTRSKTADKPKTAREVAASTRRRRTRRKLVQMEEALREEGIDERKVAKGYAGLHGTLGNSEDKGDLKLFFDVLKENTRILEPPRPPDRSACDGPVTVILKHNVPRPAR